jgi:hypothetical protein
MLVDLLPSLPPSDAEPETVIDGAFVVDEEGGPYTFVRVSYDLDNNRIDMKYSRPRGDPTTSSPAAFRLVGSLAEDGSMAGNVTSGLYGPIGTFKIKRDDSLHALPRKTKYVGSWYGDAHNVRFNDYGSVAVHLNPAASVTTNPPEFEFEYTPGRIGGYEWDGVPVGSFNQVVIDYLRRRVVMIDSSSLVNIDMTVDADGKVVSGQQTSAYYGLTSVFKGLTKY